MNTFPIKDKLSLRQYAIGLATNALPIIYTFNSKEPYDINNHIAIAKAIEKYIEGNTDLPEYENYAKFTSEIFKSIEETSKKNVQKSPNLQVKEN